MLKCGLFHVSNLIYVNKWSQICSLLNKATQRGKQAIFNPQMYKNRQHPTEAECRLFCCPILPSSCRFCSFLKLLSYRHTAYVCPFFCGCSKQLNIRSVPSPRLFTLYRKFWSYTWVSILSQSFGLKDVQEWLGHPDIKMTANIYGHLDTKRKQGIAANMQRPLPAG